MRLDNINSKTILYIFFVLSLLFFILTIINNVSKQNIIDDLNEVRYLEEQYAYSLGMIETHEVYWNKYETVDFDSFKNDYNQFLNISSQLKESYKKINIENRENMIIKLDKIYNYNNDFYSKIDLAYR